MPGPTEFNAADPPGRFPGATYMGVGIGELYLQNVDGSSTRLGFFRFPAVAIGRP
jgi:hypothetical protein